jgi:hypothetical protein
MKFIYLINLQILFIIWYTIKYIKTTDYCLIFNDSKYIPITLYKNKSFSINGVISHNETWYIDDYFLLSFKTNIISTDKNITKNENGGVNIINFIRNNIPFYCSKPNTVPKFTCDDYYCYNSKIHIYSIPNINFICHHTLELRHVKC